MGLYTQAAKRLGHSPRFVNVATELWPRFLEIWPAHNTYREPR